jgi:hypothetical protein
VDAHDNGALTILNAWRCNICHVRALQQQQQQQQQEGRMFFWLSHKQHARSALAQCC